MQWVAKQHLPLFLASLAFSVTALIGVASGSFSLHSPLPATLTCFDSVSSELRVTTSAFCSEPLISLGSAAILESATGEGDIEGLHPLLQARFTAAQSVAALEGVHLYITSGFRSEARQGELFLEAIKKYGSESEAAKWVLPPSSSHHPHGLAIDVNYPGDRSGALWLDANGARFGLCRVYANEWWHFEGVIAPGGHCPQMAANALIDLR